MTALTLRAASYSCIGALCFVAAWVQPACAAQAADLVVPPGYAIEKVAGAPEIRFPMFGAFDERGRLFVAESSGLDLYAELQKLSRTCRISVLEDRDGDGRYEVTRVFAEGLVFPMGLVWHEGKLYVADPPYVVTLEDTDGDDRADKRTTILGEFGHQDNGSLHGLIFGPDGWLYMTLGQPDGYHFTRLDGTILSGNSGALLRCRPDGSEVEVVSRGFENLVEIDFMPSGEIIGTDNWFYRPASGVRDALVHLVEGGLYPRYLRDVGTPMLVSGPPLPGISAYPAVAFSGLARCRGNAFPSMRGDFFSAQHNTRKVVQHHFQRSGATFQSTDIDFVSTQDPDFHPSDVMEDADGSLLVIDTGSWYIHHCPTGRIRHVTALGGIFRVRHEQSKPVPDPRGLQMDWNSATAADLIERLSDPREAVRQRAAEQLPSKGQEAIAGLQHLLSSDAPMPTVEKAIWVLARLPTSSSTRPLVAELRNANPDRVALAARALGRIGVPDAAEALIQLLDAPAPAVRLAAAEALARCGSNSTVPALLRAVSRAEDQFIQHNLIHALYKWAGREELLRALNDSSPRVQRAALVLLDQFPYQALPAEAAVDRLFSTDPALRQSARAALVQHTNWVLQAMPVLRRVAESARPDMGDLAMLTEVVLSFHSSRPVIEFMAQALVDDDHVRTQTRLALLEAMTHLPATQIPVSWAEALRFLVRSTIPEVKQQALRVARALQLPLLDEALMSLAQDNTEPPRVRIQALGTIIRRHPLLNAPEFHLLIDRLEPTNSANLRVEAGEILSQSRLSGAQLKTFLQRVKTDPIISPALVLSAAEHSPEASSVAGELVDYLSRVMEGGGTLPVETVTWLRKTMPAAVRPAWDNLERLFAQGEERLRSQLAELEPLLSGGDPNRGQQLFLGQATCATCHRVGEQGGVVGPDLTKIGAIRAGRDLIESLVAPNATFAQGYEPYLVTLKDGDTLSGARVRQAADDTFVLRSASGNEVRLDSAQIESVRRSQVSIMPEGLLTSLNRDEIRDLLAFLQNLK